MEPADRSAQEAALPAVLARLPGFAEAGTVLLYAAGFAEEIPTAPLLALGRSEGRRIILPRVDPALGVLRLFAIGDPAGDLVPGYRGIPEPAPWCPEVGPLEVDWALLPGLGFDARGYRLGRGAGHYDRLLPGLRPEVPTWALILDAQWVDEVPTEPHDRALRGVADHRRVVPGSEGQGRAL